MPQSTLLAVCGIAMTTLVSQPRTRCRLLQRHIGPHLRVQQVPVRWIGSIKARWLGWTEECSPQTCSPETKLRLDIQEGAGAVLFERQNSGRPVWPLIQISELKLRPSRNRLQEQSAANCNTDCNRESCHC